MKHAFVATIVKQTKEVVQIRDLFLPFCSKDKTQKHEKRTFLGIITDVEDGKKLCDGWFERESAVLRAEGEEERFCLFYVRFPRSGPGKVEDRYKIAFAANDPHDAVEVIRKILR